MTEEPSALETALSAVGDRWTLLLVEALLDGPRRFTDLSDRLGGIAPNILTSRLRRLEHEGVVVATAYSTRPPRFEYQLTAAGGELAGALRLLSTWGARHTAAGEGQHHLACGSPLEARWYCPTCERAVADDEADDVRFA